MGGSTLALTLFRLPVLGDNKEQKDLVGFIAVKYPRDNALLYLPAGGRKRNLCYFSHFHENDLGEALEVKSLRGN